MTLRTALKNSEQWCLVEFQGDLGLHTCLASSFGSDSDVAIGSTVSVACDGVKYDAKILAIGGYCDVIRAEEREINRRDIVLEPKEKKPRKATAKPKEKNSKHNPKKVEKKGKTEKKNDFKIKQVVLVHPGSSQSSADEHVYDNQNDIAEIEDQMNDTMYTITDNDTLAEDLEDEAKHSTCSNNSTPMKDSIHIDLNDIAISSDSSDSEDTVSDDVHVKEQIVEFKPLTSKIERQYSEILCKLNEIKQLLPQSSAATCSPLLVDKSTSPHSPLSLDLEPPLPEPTISLVTNNQLPQTKESPHSSADKEASAVILEDLISTKQIMETRAKSCSRKNFCAKLVHLIFTKEEMMMSNVSGRTPHGHTSKKQLDAAKIEWVRKHAFSVWPLETGEGSNQINAWKDCIKAIDEACRRLNNDKKKIKD